ncbi:MAG: LCP family protein [Eubacteriales bacterium]|nr:LCP family protein [Eubacteriales bacterium]
MKKVLILLIALMLPVAAFASPAEGMQVLLLGTDDIEYDVSKTSEMSRADAIYVAGISRENGVKLLGIERDLRVSLPDQPDNKLATTTFFGGPELCLKTINELYGLDINLYAQVDKPTLLSVVDVMGGVNVSIPEEQVKGINRQMRDYGYRLPKPQKDGTYKLNGKQSVVFLSIRDTEMKDSIESNAQRNERQQMFLQSSLAMLKTMTFDEALSIAEEVVPMINTNLTMAQIVNMIRTLQTGNADFKYKRSPITSYELTRAGVHQVVEISNIEQERQEVNAFLFK